MKNQIICFRNQVLLSYRPIIDQAWFLEFLDFARQIMLTKYWPRMRVNY